MTALIIILAILAVLFIIAMLKLGVNFSYSADGFALTCFAGPVRIQVLPKKEKKKKTGKKGKEKKDKKDTDSDKSKEKKGGSLKFILKLLPGIGEALGNFRRKLSIDKLKLYYTSASDDPFKAATGFGYASAGFGTLTAFIRRFFKVKDIDMRSNVSFEETEPAVFLEAQFSITVWDSLITGIKFLVFFLKLPKDADNKTNIK